MLPPLLFLTAEGPGACDVATACGMWRLPRCVAGGAGELGGQGPFRAVFKTLHHLLLSELLPLLPSRQPWAPR